MNKKKPNVLCTWEMGSELGHISRLSAITQGLEKNFSTTVALKDLSRAYPFYANSPTRVLQAPVWLPKIRMQRPIACLSDTLLLMGYLETDTLHSLVKAWQSIAELVEPDLIIFDYSPTAMLAYHHLDVPKVLVGSGFGDPVAGKPILDWRPHFFSEQNSKDGLMQRQEKRALESVNGVLKRQAQTPLRQLSDMFKVNHTLLQTFPEFDLYKSQRTQIEYCLKQHSPVQKTKIQFNDNSKPSVLAYLKPQHPQLNDILQGLSNCNGEVIVVCPNGQPQQFKAFANSSLQIKTEIVDLMDGLNQADLFVGHGNMSSICESLQMGTPIMALPIQLEQLLNAKNIERIKVGKLVEKVESAPTLSTQINELLENTEFRQNAEDFSRNNQQHWQTSLPDRVAQLCDELYQAHNKEE